MVDGSGSLQAAVPKYIVTLHIKSGKLQQLYNRRTLSDRTIFPAVPEI